MACEAARDPGIMSLINEIVVRFIVRAPGVLRREIGRVHCRALSGARQSFIGGGRLHRDSVVLLIDRFDSVWSSGYGKLLRLGMLCVLWAFSRKTPALK